jgi:hypothetical protein
MEKRKIFREGEFYLVERNGRFYVHGMWDQKRIRVACKTGRLDRAQLFLNNLKRRYDTGFHEDYDDPNRDWKTVAELACGRQEVSARNRGIPFDLKPADIFQMMRETDFRCAVSGIPFAKRMVLGGKRDPWAPSIDRIESSQGYSFDNVRVVCLAANYAMNEWGTDVLLRLARGVIRSSTTVSQEETHEKVAPELTPNEADTAQVIDITTKLAKT